MAHDGSDGHHYCGKREGRKHQIQPGSVYVCVCVVITFSRLGINQVWLPILLVVS